MIKVVFAKKGKAISDFEAFDFVDNIIDNYTGENIEVLISNEMVMNAFELRIFEDKIDISEVEFYIEDEKIINNKYCGFEEWKTYKEEHLLFSDIIDKIIKLGYAKMRRDRSPKKKWKEDNLFSWNETIQKITNSDNI